MKSKLPTIISQAQKGSLLMILVGESGAGKSTFCDFLNRPEEYYCSSKAIEKEIVKMGQSINHDTIHAYANQAYVKNPEWQVPSILRSMTGRRYLILDGPRRLAEVKALKRDHSNTLIIRLIASEKERYKRLQIRDGIDAEDFKRVIYDESIETELGQILAMADCNIDNSGNIEDFRQKALEVQSLLDNLEEII